MPAVSAEQGKEFLRLILVLEREADAQRRGFVEMFAPEIIRDFLEQAGVVLQQFRVEEYAALERAVLQRALAEAVDGEDGRFVEAAERAVEAEEHLAGARAVRCDELLHHRIVRAAETEGGGGIGERAANAVAQFLGRSFGEGDDENLADGKILFENQAEEKSRDGERLAGAGAGFDQRGAGGERRGRELKWRMARHAGISVWFARMGPKTFLASATNSSSSGSASRKQRVK